MYGRRLNKLKKQTFQFNIRRKKKEKFIAKRMREYNPKLTITNHTELLKDTLLYRFCIVQNNLPRGVLSLGKTSTVASTRTKNYGQGGKVRQGWWMSHTRPHPLKLLLRLITAIVMLKILRVELFLNNGYVWELVLLTLNLTGGVLIGCDGRREIGRGRSSETHPIPHARVGPTVDEPMMRATRAPVTKRLLLNWLRGETNEGNAFCEGIPGPCPPKSPEFDLKRDGGMGWPPPRGFGGPCGTIFVCLKNKRL
ncbi:glycine/D-amino acid oxidase [Striga asiatica]|uniref:Glycine/D-amino acid oxidase n=1 Tax=Striga asiatica TaxID=4170 RepID=A0A5A7Q0X1_STRAF|nr:glycine/D-amino acid oxidase [Striga asiatica]